jgi:hypothetical protein
MTESNESMGEKDIRLADTRQRRQTDQGFPIVAGRR